MSGARCSAAHAAGGGCGGAAAPSCVPAWLKLPPCVCVCPPVCVRAPSADAFEAVVCSYMRHGLAGTTPKRGGWSWDELQDLNAGERVSEGMSDSRRRCSHELGRGREQTAGLMPASCSPCCHPPQHPAASPQASTGRPGRRRCCRACWQSLAWRRAARQRQREQQRGRGRAGGDGRQQTARCIPLWPPTEGSSACRAAPRL